MHQAKAIELAREAAVDCGERHSYMPATPLLAEVWHPHRWVVDAMLLAAHEAEQQRDGYVRGNTELLELLMKLCLGESTAPLERARDILTSIGLMNADHTPNWQALEDRKPKRQTWEQAVRECVTDPAEVERLLALDDDASPEEVHAAAATAQDHRSSVPSGSNKIDPEGIGSPTQPKETP